MTAGLREQSLRLILTIDRGFMVDYDDSDSETLEFHELIVAVHDFGRQSVQSSLRSR